MNYELAKELKDAGFPQHENLDHVLTLGAAADYARKHKPDHHLIQRYEGYKNAIEDLYGDGVDEFVRIPTLSELIEACGVAFRSLNLHSNGTWDAFASPTIPQPRLHKGASPEEAVARLWLWITLHNDL